MADIIVDGTIGAKRFLLLDSTGKIPAVDGSQVTALAAGNVATDIIPIARIDVGTTANKLVQLDANAKLPALDASLLTNIPGATKSSSDPAVDTNPSGGVGSEWHNTTSGEAYICTDATTDENVWTNIGEGTGNIEPYAYAGLLYGYTSGGAAPGMNDTIDRFAFASSDDATDVGNLTRGSYSQGSFASETHGYVCGGEYGPASTRVEKFSFATGTEDASTVFDGFAGGNTHAQGTCGAHSETAGYLMSGWITNDISKITFASDGSSANWGDLTVAAGHAVGSSSLTHGYTAHNGNQNNNPTIDRFPFASNSGAVDWGDVTVARQYPWGASSSTHGYTLGGDSTTPSIIDKFPFASNSGSTDVGDLAVDRDQAAGQSSATHGYSSSGGYSVTNMIEKVSFDSGGNSVDTTADVTLARRWASGTEY